MRYDVRMLKLGVICGWIVCIGLIYMVYRTTGVWPAIAMGFLFLKQEVQINLFNKKSENEKDGEVF